MPFFGAIALFYCTKLQKRKPLNSHRLMNERLNCVLFFHSCVHRVREGVKKSHTRKFHRSGSPVSGHPALSKAISRLAWHAVDGSNAAIPENSSIVI